MRMSHRVYRHFNDSGTEYDSRESWLLFGNTIVIEGWRSPSGNIDNPHTGGVEVHSLEPLGGVDIATDYCVTLGTSCYCYGSSVAFNQLSTIFHDREKVSQFLTQWYETVLLENNRKGE